MKKSTNSLLQSTLNLYEKAIEEIHTSNELLSNNNLFLLQIGLIRHLFELARTIEILERNPDYIWLLYYELAKVKLTKVSKSKLLLVSSIDHINDIKSEIKFFELKCAEYSINLNDWKEANEAWNKQNKDSHIYNVLSEGTHLEATFLIVHYLQNKDTQKYVESKNSDVDTSNWEPEERRKASALFFNFWYSRCLESLNKAKQIKN